MSLLGSIGRNLFNAIKPLAQSAIQAVAPAATKMLQGIVGDLFTQGKTALNTFLALSPLPSPLKSLAQKLLGKGLDALQNLAQGGIEKAIAALVQKLAPRQIPGTNVTATLPTIDNRLDTAAANTPSTASSQGAASGGGTVSGGSSGTQGTSGSWGWSGGPPDPRNFDMKDPNQAAAFQSQMMQYQQAMNNISTFFTAMSNAYKAMSDTQKGIASNLR